MRKSVGSWLLASIGVLFSVPCFAGSESDQAADSSLNIHIRVFNFARVPIETWHSAQAVASAIFERTGIETVWTNCTLSLEGQYLSQDCALPPKPADIILRLVPTSKATRAHFGNAMGISALAEKGTPASASVFYDRAEDLTKGGSAPVAVILGHVTAHEIGHLLLGSNSDTSLGLMCGRWNRQSLALASDGQLNFQPREIVSLQSEVRGRTVALSSAAPRK